MIDYAAILANKYPDSEWILDGDDYDGLRWLSANDKPSKATLDALWDEVSAKIENDKLSKIAAKQSAISKLEALGLTEDEAKAIIG